MIDLKDVRLLDVLPDSIASDPSMAAIAYAIQPLLTETIENANAGDLWGRVNKLTSGQLDHLAWQYDSAVWRDSWPLSLKRQVILGVLLEKTKRGTVWAIKQAVSSLGGAVDVKTWFEMDPMGEPGTFDVQISVGQVPGQSSADSQRDLRAAIDEAKAFRSHYTLTLAEQLSAVAGLYGAVRPLVYRKLHATAAGPDPVDWDGDYETLPNLVAGWLPDRGLHNDAEGTETAVEGDAVLGWRDFKQGLQLSMVEGNVAFVVGGVATVMQDGEDDPISMYVGESVTITGSIAEAVVGSVPREGGMEPESLALAFDDPEEPSSVLMVTDSLDGPTMSFMGDAAGLDAEAFIALPTTPSFPVSLRVAGSNAELANLNGVLGEQVGYAEPIVGVTAMMVYAGIKGAVSIPLPPVLLFSEPLPDEIRTQLFNKLKSDFPAWS